jgi:hypothetical protein
MRCLRKDLRRRLPDVAAARIEIEEVQSEPLAPVSPTSSSSRSRYIWPAITLVSLLIAASLAIWTLRKPHHEEYVLRLDILVPTTETFTPGQLLSPDGRKVAYHFIGPNGKRQIWIHSLDSASATPLAGTEDAGRLAWSPDSRSLAFFSQRKIKRIASQGGPVRDVAQAGGRDLAWGASDVIVFGGQGKGLSQVSALGGPIRQVTELSGMEVTHDHQSFLPDGRRFFYMARRGSNAEDWDVYVGSIDSKKRHLIPGIHAAVKYASSGHLLFNRNGTETLVAQPFDLVQLRVTGEPFTVAEGRGGVSGATFATSENGSIAYIGIGKFMKRRQPGSNEAEDRSNPPVPPGSTEIWPYRRTARSSHLTEVATAIFLCSNTSEASQIGSLPTRPPMQFRSGRQRAMR